MTPEILEYIANNATELFDSNSELPLQTVFDSKGFSLSKEAKVKYNEIRNNPHLYISFTKNDNGYYYIGKSNQKGGRWKRSHAYH